MDPPPTTLPLDLLQTIVESIPVRAFWKDRASRYLGCNTAFARDAGVASPAELIGRTDHDLGWREQAELYRADDRQVMESGVPRLAYEEPQTTADGRTIWLRTSKVPLRDATGAVIGVLGIYDDITAQREAEELLRFTQFATDRAPDAIARFDASGRLLYANATLGALVGFTVAELTAGRVADIALDFDDARFASWWQSLERSGSQHFESQLRHRDGRLIPVEVSANHVRFGARECVVTFMRDATGRHASAAQLRESEQRFRDLFEKSPDPCWLINADNLFVLCNQAAATRLGYDDPDELRHTHPSALSPPFQADGRCSRAAAEAMMARAHADGVHRFEWIHRTRAGRDLPVEVTLARIEFDGQAQLYCVWRDISERKAQERALLESRRLHEEAQRIARLGHWQLDHRTGALRWSDETFRILGLEPTPGDVGYETFTGVIHPDDRAAVDATFAQAVRTRTPYVIDHRVVTPAGETRWIAERGETTYDGDQPVSSVGTVADITERRRAEEAHDRLRAQLAATQRLESVGRLAGGVAHDFNNTLAVILGSAQLATEQVAATHPVQTELREILDAAQRSSELTRQLLAFARRQTVRPVALDLDAKVEGLLRMLRRLIGEDIALEWVPGADVPPVSIDPSQVDQLLANLCVNARDAITGVGTVRIETATTTMAPPDAAPGEPRRRYVCLTVADTGRGMDEAVLANLFEPFFTTKDEGRGTGLGLATVYGIVKQNHGHITVESQPGQGTRFRIYLPATDVAPAAAPPPRAAPRPRARPAVTVLLVEDEPAVMRLTRRMLEKLGYTVLAAESGGEALRLSAAHAEPIHLLISDVIMPGMRGRDLADQLRAARPTLQVLFMSGYTADVLAPQGVLAADIAFLQKPFTFDELAARVRALLDDAQPPPG